MALKKLVQLGIFLIIAVVAFNFIKKQSFFKTEPGQISSGSIPASTDTADNVHLQNEQIKTQLHRLNSRTQAQYVAGCMKTPAGCTCYDARAKPVKVTASICAQNVRDASGNQHKIFDQGTHSR